MLAPSARQAFAFSMADGQTLQPRYMCPLLRVNIKHCGPALSECKPTRLRTMPPKLVFKHSKCNELFATKGEAIHDGIR